MVGLTNHFDVEAGITRHLEAFPGGRGLPLGFTLEAVAASAGDRFHHLGLTGIEGQAGGQDDTNGLLAAIGKQHSVTDALAIKVNVGLLDDGHAVELGRLGHFFSSSQKSFDAKQSLDDAFGREADESDSKTDKHPDCAVLTRLGLQGELANDEDHVNDQPSHAEFEGNILELCDGQPEEQRCAGIHACLDQPRLAFALAAMRMRSAFRRMKPWASF